MKRLKFLIVVLGVFATQGIFAVTLPTTSYSDGYYSNNSGNETIFDSGTMIRGHYLQLGDGNDDYSACEGDGNGYAKNNPGQTCADCCRSLIPGTTIPDFESRAACIAYCEPGPALPLDAPLWFMLVIAVLSVTLRAANYAASESRRQVYLDYAERSK